ncbi:MAG: caspase family protein [Cyanobacteria bacterium J06582_2]
MSQFKRNLAITIGINKYQNGISSLATAVNDAEEVARILQHDHGYQVWDLLEEQATLIGCLRLLEEFLPDNVTESDRLIFYFAGHGIALNSDDGLEGFLIPQDAQLGDTSTYLPMARLKRALDNLPCRHFLCILDCCFAGAFRWSSTRDLLIAPEVIHQERYDRFIEAAAWQVLTSTSHNQLAADLLSLSGDRDETDSHHSPFAAALIEALQGQADASPPGKDGKPAGDGIITATELYLYLRDRVEIASEGKRQLQTPGLFPLNKHDRGEYIFLTPGHELNLPPAPPLDESQNPYRGLESFAESNSSLFFGRQILSEKLYQFCQQQPLTVVLGASGTGKSSLVNAGLIPYIRSLKDEKWAILSPMRPGESPFLALNDVLLQIDIGKDESNGKGESNCCRGERPFPKGLAPHRAPIENVWEYLNQWMQSNPNQKLLVVIDQVEELFTLCRQELEREKFLSLLSKAIATYPNQLRLIFTLRSDFEPQLRNTELEHYWMQSRFVISPMNREELREAIEKPASERVMYFDPPSLVDRLIDEVIQMPGAMPLLSFALSELYLKYLSKVREGTRDKRAITEADYEELGGVARSLTKRADGEYQSLVKQDSAYHQIICQVMLRMLAVDGGNIARRRVFLGELKYPQDKQFQVKQVIDRFLNARLLVSGVDTTGENYIEPAHDALVVGWQQLLVWQQQEQENLVLQRRLTRAALEWEKQQKSSFLWHGNPRLNLLQQVLQSNNNWFNQLEMEFVRRSIRQKQRNIIGRWSFVAGAFLTVLTFYQLSILLEKAGLVKNLLTNKPIDALTLAIETTGKNRLLPLPVSRQVQSSLLDAVQEIRERKQLIGHDQKVNVVAYSPDGSQILTGSSDRTLRLWNSQGESVGQPLQGHTDTVTSAAFSPNGQLIVSGSDDETIRLWDESGKSIGQLIKHEDTVTAIAFSPNGKLIASSSDDGRIRLWNTQGNPIGEAFIGHEDTVTAIAFSPDGRLIASASEDRTVRVWDTQGDRVIRPWRKHQDLVNAVAFSPDGKLIASGGDDEKIRLWDLQGNEVTKPFIGHVGIIWSIAFSQDGETIVSASSDRTIRFWDLQGNQVKPPLRGHLGLINSIAVHPDGDRVVSSSSDNTVRLWNVDDNPVSQVLRGHQGHVKDVAISSDGELIVSAGQDSTVRRWNRSGIPVGKSFFGHQNVVNTVAISQDDRLIVSGSKDKTIRLWDKTGNLIHTLVGHEAEVTSVAIHKNLIVSASEDKTIRLWDTQGNSMATLSGHEDGVTSVAISLDGNKLISASRDRTVRLWDLNQKKELEAWSNIYDSGVMSVNFSPDGQQIISGSRDGTMRLINLKDNSVSDPFIGHEGIVNSAVFSPDGEQIISGSRDRTVRIWDTQGNQLITPFRGHEGYVDSVVVNPDNNKIISASWDGTIRIWSTKREEWLQAGCDRLKNRVATGDRQISFWCKNQL